MKTKTFTSTSDDYTRYNGPVKIIRPLTEKEADIFDVGPMFLVEAAQGVRFHAFGDELR